jgi:hypothetical protein
MKPIKVTVKLTPGYDNAIGTPVYKFDEGIKQKIGKIVEYDKQSGNAVVEISEQIWKKIAGNNIGITSRSENN